MGRRRTYYVGEKVDIRKEDGSPVRGRLIRINGEEGYESITVLPEDCGATQFKSASYSLNQIKGARLIQSRNDIALNITNKEKL